MATMFIRGSPMEESEGRERARRREEIEFIDPLKE
jgi:hypothetical protein